MVFILGKKIEMSQIFSKDGEVIPVTIVEAGPCWVTEIRTKEKDGYQAIQLGYQKTKKINKPQKIKLEKIKVPYLKYFREFKITQDNQDKFKLGQKIDLSQFKEGMKVIVSGNSKGKGFQGVVKRHGFKGAPKTHGTKDQWKAPGSIGATGPQRVFKGTKMAGRMGNKRVTVKNLEIVKIDLDKNLLYLKGAVPGPRGNLLEIKTI